MAGDLVNRLRRTYGASKVIHEALVNPDGPEAADRIAQLEAEITFLKEIIFLHIDPSEVRPEYYKKVHTILEELSQ